jgi:RND superfamily putative drug exporter
MEQLTRRLGELSARRPWSTIGVWAVLTALIVVLAGAVGGTLVDDFSAPGTDSAKAQGLLEKNFPQAAGGIGVAVFAAPDGTKLDASRPAVEAALGRLRKAKHVATVSDPFTTGRLSTDGRIGYAEISLDLPASDLGAAGADTLFKTLKPARDSGLTAELGGDVASFNKKNESGSEGFGLLAALIVLIVAFGTVLAALVPISIAAIAVATGLSGITLLANGMNVSTAAPVFGAMMGLGVGIDYSLFIISRYRDNRAAGMPNAAALSRAMATSGAAVFFAGATVVVSLAALVLTGITLLAGIGVATSVVVLFAVATALTLLPAILSLLGDRVDSLRVPGRRKAAKRAEDTSWWRLAHRISARPWPYLIGSSVLLLALAAPALSMTSGFPDAGGDNPNTTQRKAYDLLADGFGPGYNAPMLVVANLKGTGLDAQDITDVSRRLTADPGIADVGAARTSADGETVVLPTLPTTAPADAATRRTLERVRAFLPAGVLVTGPTALTLDLDKKLADTLPLFIGAILVVSFVLLVMVFRSIAVPLKAAVMNLLSIGGAYGVVVAVFQWGWLGGLFGLDQTYRIVSLFPTLFFAVLFGLSMDYEVFLVSRIRDAYRKTGDNTEAVARGLAATGRVITSGALIMICVFLSFVTNPDPSVKMIGLGLAAAIAIDATLVRMVLVPATMALLGPANWWLPGWLDRRLPDVHVEGAEDDQLVDLRAAVVVPRMPDESESLIVADVTRE